MVMEEEKLAIRCARGDNEARRELYEKYGSRILALCRRYAADPSDAEDLKQDAFIKIFRVIDHYRWTGPGSLYSWMSRVTLNMAFDSANRRRALAQQLVDVENLENAIPEEPVYDYTSSVPPEVLSEMIGALPEGYRTVFKLYCIDGLTHKEIASLLGIKEKSSSASLSRARALLSDAIEQNWREQDGGDSAEGWSRILSKMRRARALHSGLIAFAILLPATALLLWRSSHQPSVIIAEAVPSAESTQAASPVILSDNEESDATEEPRPIDIAQGHSDASTQDNTITFAQTQGDTTPTVIPDDDPVIQSAPNAILSSPNVILSDSEESDTSTVITHITVNPQRQRPRLSLGIKAGSGTTQRSSAISLQTTNYIMALAFMNFADPSTLINVKSNYNNTMDWFSRNSSNFNPDSYSDSYRHDFPVSLGLLARMELTPRLGIESGIEYTYLHSTIETMSVKLDQQLLFIGIPVRMDASIWSQGNLDFYVGLGAKVEKCVSARLGKINCEEKRLQWSAEAFSGVQYRIGTYSHLFFQPELSYSFTSTDLITCRTENPLIFTLNAGIRFDL